MGMVNYKPIYLSKERKNQTSVETINECIMHPGLMRRLVTLHDDKVRLDNENENPWFQEMNNHNISVDTVKDAKDFLKFCNREDAKKQKSYLD